MTIKTVEIYVYGAEVLCPSCVNLPSSKETFEWLQAAISRKYPHQPFSITNVDINHPPNDPKIKEFSSRVIEEEMFYPIVVVEDVIAGEGNPKLKTIYAEMEKYGYTPVS